ncbi:Hypothetical protein D9617_16g014160 [Elsinoe fawcettii]|nr:Hypothetical protein D9617_16g014160 [Elsinoe fawcettii]
MSLHIDTRVDESTARIPNRYLTTIEEVDEGDFEDVDMDEKGLLSNEYRTPLRPAFRRRLYLQLSLCIAIGIFILHAVLSNHPTPTSDLVHLQDHSKHPTGPPQPYPSPASLTSQPSPAPSPATSPEETNTTSPTLTPLENALQALPQGEAYSSLLAPSPSEPTEAFAHLEWQFRTFSTLLPLYESLHSPAMPGAPLHPRWSPQDLARSGPGKRDPEALGEEVRGYETFLYLFKHLAHQVAPWDGSAEETVGRHRKLESEGRGVVMTLPSPPHLHVQRRRDMIERLREEGCELPVEVVYLRSGGLSEMQRKELEMEGVVLRALEGMVGDEEWVREETLKPFALLLSRFREAVFLNTDVLPDRPGGLFEDEKFEDRGALFLRAQGPRLNDTDGTRVDHNVVVVDKWRHFVALLASVRLAGSEFMKDDGLLDELEVKKDFGQSEMWRLGFEMVSEVELEFFSR